MADNTTQQQPREYREFDPNVIQLSNSGGDYADYVKLEPEEPFPAYVQSIKLGSKFNRTTNAEEDRVFVWCEVTDGPGKGQTYRTDFNPKLTPPTSPKQSKLSEFLLKVYGEPFTGRIDPDDLLGRPIRIELSEPWGEKNIQFINSFKKPLSSQQRVDVTNSPKGGETNSAEALLSGDELEAELDKVFGS